MNIYAQEGDKVVLSGSNGTDADQALAMKHLDKGLVYTVDYTEVSAWYTDVYLKEAPGIPFNSVIFNDHQEGDNDGKED